MADVLKNLGGFGYFATGHGNNRFPGRTVNRLGDGLRIGSGTADCLAYGCGPVALGVWIFSPGGEGEIEVEPLFSKTGA